MINHDRQRRVKQPASNEQSTSTLLLTMADTTWRMITPTAILAIFAVCIDLKLHTKPWLTLLSLPIGLSLSALLIRRQMREIQ